MKNFIPTQKSLQIQSFPLATQFSFVMMNRNAYRREFTHDLPFVMIQSNFANYKQVLDFSHINERELTNYIKNATSIAIKCIVAKGS